jgi:hypothetical protein
MFPKDILAFLTIFLCVGIEWLPLGVARCILAVEDFDGRHFALIDAVHSLIFNQNKKTAWGSIGISGS